METFKIGEVAARTNVNKETVRYYEKRDLITEPQRRRSGYRIFTQQQIDEINFIKRAQQLGFTLSEIKDMMNLRVKKVSCNEVRNRAKEKYQDVVDKIEDLKSIRDVLLNLIDSCKSDEQKTDDCIILDALNGDNKMGRQLR